MSMSSQNASADRDAAAKPAKRRRGRDRVEALKLAAIQVFAEKGYDTATMTEVAARAASSIGSLYQFFPTKEILAEAVHQDLIDAIGVLFRDMTARTAGAPASDIADMIFDDFARFVLDHPEFAILAERRDIPKERKIERRRVLLGQIAAVLARAEPPLPAADLPVMAGLVLQVMKVAVAAALDTDAAEGASVATELRAMLRLRLG
jgi:AcrR family transcriptional regulator